MKQAGRLTRMIVGAAMSAVTLSVGGMALSSVATATQTMTATTYVNMRSGPGTSYGVLGVLSPNQSVLATGTVQGGWYQVTADGVTGWVFRDYLRAAASAPTPTSTSSTSSVTELASSTTAAGTATATGNVNIRSGPGTSYAIVGVLAKGASISTTGATSGSWTQVVHNGTNRWIYSSYLTTGSGGGTTAPATGKVRTTANLYLRTEGNINAPYTGVLPGNSIVDTTGETTADYTQIVYQGETRWIATRYTTAVSTGPTSPTPPASTGTVYVTVGVLNVRATSAADGEIVGQVTRGTALPTTGVYENGRTQIIYQGAARWVYSPYVSTSQSSTPGRTLVTSGISQLTPSAKRVYDAVVANFPRITTIYGWRASSAYSSDHPNGRAVDVMLPSPWSANVDLGWEVAHYFQERAAEYNISYIIYRQSVWNAAYPSRGWRAMEDRGSVTQNHFDHVHISVKS